VEQLYDKVFLHLTSPTFGNDVRRLVSEVATLAGVARVRPRVARFQPAQSITTLR